MNRKCLFIVFLSFSLSANAQNTYMDDFLQFRQNMQKDYDDFRNSIMEDYDKYLDSVWKEYEKFTGYKRDETPKPKVVPVFKPTDTPPKPVVVEPVVAPKSEPIPQPEPKPRPIAPSVPSTPSAPQVPSAPTLPSTPTPLPKMVTVDFYSNDIKMPAIENDIVIPPVNSRSDIAKAWKELKVSSLKNNIPTIKTMLRTLGMSDWGNAMLIEKYVESLFPQCDVDQQRIATQFLLSNLGYDVRLATNDNQIVLLIPFDEKIYDMPYLKIAEKTYYIYPDNNGQLMSCSLPEGDTGRKMGTIFSGNINIGIDYRSFTLSGAGIQVKGKVNTAIMPLLNSYVSLGISDIAKCNVDKSLRNSIVEQVREQVKGLNELQAANKILQFVQYAFDYATDEEQFGREKYFFMEENLFYPKNDCEDRSVFFAYLIREVLHLPVHLVHYPGHECTAVAYSSPLSNGTTYTYKGKTYYISDPTYVGANIGMCMPEYLSVKPEIEEW